MADLVAELRASAMPDTHVGDCMSRAADEIERLRSGLRRIANSKDDGEAVFLAVVVSGGRDMRARADG